MKRLAEAATLADQAVAAAPGNAAYLDTCAEAHFRLNDRARAVDLESKALKIKPGDSFMEGQLKRFQTKTPKSPLTNTKKRRAWFTTPSN